MNDAPLVYEIVPHTEVVEHFTARAQHYDRSSRWCADPAMMEWLLQLCAPTGNERMLDVACGTGLVARAFRQHVKTVIGVDPTPAMASYALPWLDDFFAGVAEQLPFVEEEFDITVCRQGLQFMQIDAAVSEMVRVTRTGGKVALVNLCAYGDGDESEYFEILRLRNPARKNFFLPNDLKRVLTEAGCGSVQLLQRHIDENVELWADNKAISSDRCKRIREMYEAASPRFRELHQLRYEQGHVIDRMLFAVAIGSR
jgi:ubiquinone/menaquinone biosynthesis C-methylase UbiE